MVLNTHITMRVFSTVTDSMINVEDRDILSTVGGVQYHG